jgi:two-component system, OmpR family, phosphate regulon sensor histidine kinase PhoR
VHGEREDLVQVFQNLIHNAIRYGRPGGNVTVRVESQQQRLRVLVTDDGPGIAPQHLPRLTERFYRIDVAASRKKEGTGLGLAIVKHVVNRHRGELTIASELGKGSTFAVTLPEVVRAVAPRSKKT